MGGPRKTPSSARRSTVTTTDKQFASKLLENGVIYEVIDVEPPDDVDTVKAALLKPRAVPVLAKRDWEKMCEAKRYMAQGKLSLESMIVESMLYQHDSPFNYLRYRNDQWTEIDNEITAGISDPKPDVTEAHTWSAYPPGSREDIEELVASQYGYAMPTFAMESKGPSGDQEQAAKQAAYDGAVMTHAALAIDGHVGKGLDFQFRKTKAITVTLSPVEINVYANHAILDEARKRRSYHQYRLIKVQYLDSEEEWNRAHVVVSNAQDIALGLASLRIQALWDHFRAEKAKQEQMKAQDTRLRTMARAKTTATMAPPPSGRKKIDAHTSKRCKTLDTKVETAVTPPS